MKIDGRFWFTKENESFLGAGRIELLERIDTTGSINAAAKEMKMSYKAAWERINGMNALADNPLIERITGGRGGGGTKLTPYAHELIKTYKRFNELHREFINRFSQAGSDPERLVRILSRTFLTTSARNQFTSTIKSIETHNLQATITLSLSSIDTLKSTISLKSVTNMGLQIGSEAYAIIKSSDITIQPYSQNITPIGNDNLLLGTIESLEFSGDLFEVGIRLEGGTLLIALTQQSSLNHLQLNSKAYATISPLHVIIGL